MVLSDYQSMGEEAKTRKSDGAWVSCCDQYGDYEGALSGSRDGFIQLRDYIDRVLDSGEVEIPKDSGVDFTALRLHDTHPEERKEESSAKTTIAKFGCITVLLSGLALAVLGAYQIFMIAFQK